MPSRRSAPVSVPEPPESSAAGGTDVGGTDVDVVVVGAGVAGAVATVALSRAGRSVLLVDKGRSVGGRLATRRIADARLDHGAQFFTVRSEQFESVVADWQQRGIVDIWCRGFGDTDGHPRYRAAAGMNALVRAIVAGADAPMVELDTLVFAVRPAPSLTPRRWEVVIDDGRVHRCDAVVLTAPIPQSASLLVTAGVDLPTDLVTIDYHRTLALLVALDRPSTLAPPGGLDTAQLAGTGWSFIADNHLKAISPTPALTLHADHERSRALFDLASGPLLEALLAEAAPWIGRAGIVEAQVKKWRLATPERVWPAPSWSDPSTTLVLAGDAFAGPKVSGSNLEGAYLSGTAAAAILLGS